MLHYLAANALLRLYIALARGFRESNAIGTHCSQAPRGTTLVADWEPRFTTGAPQMSGVFITGIFCVYPELSSRGGR